MPATSVEIKLTPAQLKALMLLPADGRWSFWANGISRVSGDALVLRNLTERQSHCLSPGSGRYAYRYRLTPAGIAERKKREGAS